MKKKVISVLAAAAMATSMFATPGSADGRDVKAGVVWYNFGQILLSQMPAKCLNGIAAADGNNFNHRR